MKDWKNGCLQAERYLCFSDYSYLALPQENINKVDLEVLKKSGIALLPVKEDEVEEILIARKSNICDERLKYMITSKIVNIFQRKSKMNKTNILKKYLFKN